ncbi:MAG TPA: 50S ribosomal protein L15 [Planctomycetota bacterium]|jgi:large subunit ribosomal protein L15|nr:50S ribosomal protein L15 [Planctomycetota bacterium]MDP6129470.1 50S ribosomal protein L15 [Planctomycetota bacterium]MDP7245995.1 50S ribosomal protein L15 [Planctomycetota bacterium]HJM38949.1 50S ribosomal protein L15 [Planctomycetota bacterium]|tara:strand:- start:5143 stop:5589 length:447 start_codon:yes stop_codon:yes gene_type:complete
MQIHDVTPKGVKYPNRKRVGRGVGSGLGKTAGRGHKGQNSRSGGGVRPGFEGGQMPLFRKVPKRGFTNARFKKHYTLVNVQSLNSFPEGTEVELASVLEKGLARRTGGMLKVLGQGEISVKLTVRAHRFSDSAKAKIEAAGGTVEVLG